MPSNGIHEGNVEDFPIVYADPSELIKSEPALDIDAAEERNAQLTDSNLWVSGEEVTAANLMM